MQINNNRNLLRYIKFLTNDQISDIEITNGQSVLSHIQKLDIFISSIIKLYIFALSFLSRIFFLRPLWNLKQSQIIFLIRFIFIFNFLIKKIDQVLYTIINLHFFAKEEMYEIPIKKTINEHGSNHYKFIVIGSGPSGSVTACELSKKYNDDVLIIEKGGYYNVPKSKHPGDEFLKKWYRGGVNTTYYKQMIAYSSGCCFGGGSEINSGLYHRPDEEFLSKWANEYHTKGMDINDVNPHIKRVDELTNFENSSDDEFLSLLKRKKDKSLKTYSGLNKFYNYSESKKNSMTNTLLTEFLANNGKVSLFTEAKQIRYNKKRWEIEVEVKNEKNKYTCDYLFICSGSIYTNNLLIKSGIAKDKHKVISKFQFHPMIKMIAAYNENLQEINDDVSSYQDMKYWPNFIIGNASSSIQFLLSSFQKNIKLREFIFNNWKKMKVFHATFSLGFGKIINIPFVKEPILLYFLSASEKRLIQQSSLELYEYIKDTGPNSIIPILSKPNDSNLIKIDRDEYSPSVIINQFQISSVHILGGITMGEKSECVANSYGKINGYNNLYVNDSSLINTKLLKNPQGTIMMIAYRNIKNFMDNQ